MLHNPLSSMKIMLSGPQQEWWRALGDECACHVPAGGVSSNEDTGLPVSSCTLKLVETETQALPHSWVTPNGSKTILPLLPMSGALLQSFWQSCPRMQWYLKRQSRILLPRISPQFWNRTYQKRVAPSGSLWAAAYRIGWTGNYSIWQKLLEAKYPILVNPCLQVFLEYLDSCYICSAGFSFCRDTCPWL